MQQYQCQKNKSQCNYINNITESETISKLSKDMKNTLSIRFVIVKFLISQIVYIKKLDICSFMQNMLLTSRFRSIRFSTVEKLKK
jgi:hypothetical protein